MNNSHFRRLLGEQTPARQSNAASPLDAPSSGTSARKSIVPMTPRNVKGGIGVDFARQVRERNAARQPSKKFKSYAPKGVKLGAGYTDRAQAREEVEDKEDDKAARIQALEEQMKLGQISPETFESLRDTIAGGDILSTHLVKGLDRRLLERIRRGEDVLEGTGDGEGREASLPQPPDVDEELDKLGQQEMQTVQHAKEKKKGALAIAGKKRNRDQIMAELKAQRLAAAEAKVEARPKVKLDNRWKKIGEQSKNRITVDAKGREVLITVDADGIVKRMIRNVAAPEEMAENTTSASAKVVLGADVLIPEIVAKPELPLKEDHDDDIFDGVGAAYNPLGDEADDDDDDLDDSDGDSVQIEDAVEAADTLVELKAPPSEIREVGVAEVGLTAKPADSAPRNYFNDNATVSADAATGDRFAGIENVLKKAANLDPLQSGIKTNNGGNDQEAARLQKRAQMLAQQDRDLDDMDMGFGSSRFEDEQDGGEGDTKMKLSEWKGGDDAGQEEDGGKGGGKKKRKPKKRKGDVNNAADIMRVIEGRKKKD